jgi:spore coat polysaccharide biosynthesis predicted glycosyltransferase SpsG
MSQVLIMVRGDAHDGMGHVVRQLVLARALSQRGVDVCFETAPDTPGHAALAASGFLVRTTPYTEKFRFDAVLVDVESGPSRATMEGLRCYPRVVVFCGSGQALAAPDAVRAGADLVVYQSVLPDDGLMPHVLAGPEWLILDPRYAHAHASQGGHVVVCYGGTDFGALTERTVAALAGGDRPLLAVTGPARDPLATVPDGASTVHAPPSLVSVLDGAALFIGALGMSALEAVRVGVPCVLNGWTPDHVRTAEHLQRLGAARNLGLAADFDPDVLRCAVETFEWKYWPSVSRRCRELVDGDGARRVAEAIGAMLQ